MIRQHWMMELFVSIKLNNHVTNVSGFWHVFGQETAEFIEFHSELWF